MSSILRGSCYCGSVAFSVNSTPAVSAYCHCTICQRLFCETFLPYCIQRPLTVFLSEACPFVHTLHFPASAFSWTHPEPRLDSYIPTEKPHKTRWRCKDCGSHLSSYNSKTNRWSVWACVLERDEQGHIKNWDIIKPSYHIFYGTKVIEVNDGLGKWEGYENKSKRIA